MGNICRSPTAHAVFQKVVDKNKLSDAIKIDSAGTHDYHIGKKPDQRATTVAAKRGYDLSQLYAREVVLTDFEHFDYVLAMDSDNYADLNARCNEHNKHKITRFLNYASQTELRDVPDPYYGKQDGFERVLDLVEDACQGLLLDIKQTHLHSFK